MIKEAQLSYSDAQAMMDTPAGRRNGYRKLENHTYLWPTRDGSYAVRLHATDVVTIHADGTFTLDTGGWYTVTTKDRINRYSPARVYSERGVWCVWTDSDPRTAPRVRKCGKCHGSGQITVDDWGMVDHYRIDTEHVHYTERDGQTYPGYEWELDRSWKPAPAPLQRNGRPVTGQPECIAVVGQVKRRRGYAVTGHHQTTCDLCDGSGEHDYGSVPNPVRFADGMRVRADGSAVGRLARLHDTTGQDKRNARTEKRITRYVDGLTDSKIKKLYESAESGGMAGDCWFCSMHAADGRSMGEIGDNADHLTAHLTERYYMGSLIMNALRSKGYRQPETIFYMGAHGRMGDQVRSAVRLYFRKNLVTGRQVR